MSLAEIQQQLTAAGARRLSPEVPVWHLQAPWWPFSRRARRFDDGLAAILQAAFALPGPSYLVIDENPQEYEVGGPWTHAADGTWLVPSHVMVPGLLERVLGVGNWWIYAAPRSAEATELPDTFRRTPVEVAEFALGHDMAFLAHAFFDNDPWRIYVEPVSAQGRIAA